MQKTDNGDFIVIFTRKTVTFLSMFRPPEKASLALKARHQKDHRKPGIVIGHMPETPVLVIGKAAQQEPDDVSLWDTGMRSERRMKTDQKKMDFLYSKYNKQGLVKTGHARSRFPTVSVH